jgi:putative SOS response-associated peptidase YedK
MCGRYDSLIPRDAMEHLFEAASSPASNFPPRYNIAPTQEVPIVKPAREGGGREITMARWGLVPFYMKAVPKVPHINARAETIDRTGLFREAFASRHCLVPATGFYEWERLPGAKQPYRFRLKSEEPFAFAGLGDPGAKELLRPFPAELMESHPVSTFVNHHENDSEECIRPIALDGNAERSPRQPGLPGL